MILRWLKLQRPVAHVEKALEYFEKVLYEVYHRIISQIEYVRLVLRNPGADRSKLREINFGIGGLAERY